MLPDPADEFAAFKALLEANEVPAVDQDQATTNLPDVLAVLHLSRRYTDPTEDASLYGGMRSRTGRRLVLKASGKTPGECRWVLWQATRALEGKRVLIGDADLWTTPLAYETDDLPERDDDGYYTAAVTWIYSLEDQ